MVLIPIVDDNDQVICYKERSQVQQQDIYRVASLWVMNSRGDVLLARRAWTKRNNPGMWSASAAGTVEKGETYYENIVREAAEELGIIGVTPVEEIKERATGDHNFFYQQYSLVLDWDIDMFTVQESEVAEIRWFSRAELDRALREHPGDFSPAIYRWLTYWEGK